MRGSRPVRSLKRSRPALTSLSFAGLAASKSGMASLRSLFIFTSATASDSGREDIRGGTAGAAALRPRVWAVASNWKSATKTIARIKSLVVTTNNLSAKNMRDLVDALTCLRVVLHGCQPFPKLSKSKLFIIFRNLKQILGNLEFYVRKFHR